MESPPAPSLPGLVGPLSSGTEAAFTFSIPPRSTPAGSPCLHPGAWSEPELLAWGQALVPTRARTSRPSATAASGPAPAPPLLFAFSRLLCLPEVFFPELASTFLLSTHPTLLLFRWRHSREQSQPQKSWEILRASLRTLRLSSPPSPPDPCAPISGVSHDWGTPRVGSGSPWGGCRFCAPPEDETPNAARLGLSRVLQSRSRTGNGEGSPGLQPTSPPQQ